jgi:hypothetical protein
VTVQYTDSARLRDALEEVLGIAVVPSTLDAEDLLECRYCGESVPAEKTVLDVKHADECPVPTLVLLQVQLCGWLK